MVGRPSGVRDERWGGETRQFRKGGSRRRYTREGTYLAPSIGRAEPYFGYATKRSRLAMRSLVRCTSVGTFKTCRPVLTMSVCWVNQKSRPTTRNVEIDPGCVKTLCRCYDSPVILGGID